MLASLVILLSFEFVLRIEFHLHHFEEQIQLEDTTLKALIILSNSIEDSHLNYCSPINSRLENDTQDKTLATLDLHQAFLLLNQNHSAVQSWGLNRNGGGKIKQSPLLVTYRTGPVIYIDTPLKSGTKEILANANTNVQQGDFLLLDDCRERILARVSAVRLAGSGKTLILTSGTKLSLQMPVAILPLAINVFYVGANNANPGTEGLYRYDQHERVLLFPLIHEFKIQNRVLQVEARDGARVERFHHVL